MKTKQFCLAAILMIGGIGIIIQPTTVRASTNLLSNGNFENWTNPNTITGWNFDSVADSCTQETNNVLSGNSSAKLTSGPAYGWLDLSQFGIPITIGETYTYSVWVFDNTPNVTVTLALWYGHEVRGVIRSTESSVWQQLVLTAEADYSNGGVYILIETHTGTAGDCYVDAAALHIGSSPMDVVEPHITFTSPNSSVTNPSSLWLNFTIDEATSWIGYSLDGSLTITITSNTSISDLTSGSHVIVLYANDSAGNMGKSSIGFTVDATPPEITLRSPLNATYNNDWVLLIIDHDDTCNWIVYSLDGSDNITIEGDMLLEGLSDGVHSFIVYANDSFNNMAISTVLFTVNKTLATSWISYTTVITIEVYETSLVTQTKATAEFATLAMIAGIVGVFILKRKRREQ